MNEKARQNNDQNNKHICKTNIIFFIMFVLLTCTDQISKKIADGFLRTDDIELIPGVLQLHYLENKGAAWGILKNQTWFLITITLVVLVVIAYVFYKLPDNRKFWLLRFGLVLLAAGALGNFIDRMINHYVIDFIYFSLINFPVFNLADCFVCISAVLILYCILFKYKDDDFEWRASKKEKQTAEERTRESAEEETQDGTNHETAGTRM